MKTNLSWNDKKIIYLSINGFMDDRDTIENWINKLLNNTLEIKNNAYINLLNAILKAAPKSKRIGLIKKVLHIS